MVAKTAYVPVMATTPSPNTFSVFKCSSFKLKD